MPSTKAPPAHPGEILLLELLEPLGLSQYRLAKDISLPARRDTALRLARYLGTSERFWLNLQSRFDLEVEKDRLGERLEKEVPRRAV